MDPDTGYDDDDDDEWADVWEHVRLLGDSERTHGLVDFLGRTVPGRTVLEVGCGMGLLSCVAARLGARHVYGVEPTVRIHDARALVEANGLEGHVTLIRGRIEDLEPRPVDLAFSELLNADPMTEGLLSAMDAAARWCGPRGVLAPQVLRLHTALILAPSHQADMEAAQLVIDRLSRTHDLDVEPVLDALLVAEPCQGTRPYVEVRSTSAQVWDLPLGGGARPPPRRRVTVKATHTGPSGGAVVWFEATYDDALTLHNRPDAPGHWGVYATAWPEPLWVKKGERVHLAVELSDDDRLMVRVAR